MAEIYQPNFLTAKNYLAALMKKALERAGREQEDQQQEEQLAPTPTETEKPEPFDIKSIQRGDQT